MNTKTFQLRDEPFYAQLTTHYNNFNFVKAFNKYNPESNNKEDVMISNFIITFGYDVVYNFIIDMTTVKQEA